MAVVCEEVVRIRRVTDRGQRVARGPLVSGVYVYCVVPAEVVTLSRFSAEASYVYVAVRPTGSFTLLMRPGRCT